MGRSPGVVLVPGVGASLRGVGVLDLRPGVEDLSFCRWNRRGGGEERKRDRENRVKIPPNEAASRQKI